MLSRGGQVAQVPGQVSPEQLAAQSSTAGVHVLYIKAADGSTPDPQFTPALVGTLRIGGVSVCAWTFAYGLHPVGEAAEAVAAMHSGAQCLVVKPGA